MADEQVHGAPARISLDDLIETVTRSVMRAMESEGEVAGYAMPATGQPLQGGVRPPLALGGPWGGGPIIIGLVFNPAQLPQMPQ